MLPRWSETTAVFGGTFDPPHVGHRIAAQGLLTQPGVSRVLVIPTGISPLKTGFTPAVHRLEMARLGFTREAQIDDREVRFAEAAPRQPTYTFDTLGKLRQEFPRLAFALGTDQLPTFPRWHRFPEILSLCHWIILDRAGQNETEKFLRAYTGSGLLTPIPASLPTWKIAQATTFLTLVPTSAPELSSTLLRAEMQRTGKLPATGLAPEVAAYIRRHHLFGVQE
ncbi:MAG: nicotinate (nicotinamide) nucleotide adenylyltransferase [Bacteriovoracia bacterium]